MKLFFYIIYPLFFFAMGCGIYVAFRDAEGLVDNNYYENSKGYFEAKAAEERLGIAISPPATLKRGENEIRIAITSKGKPLEQANLTLFIGNLSSSGYDSTITMREHSPGVYQATAEIPFKGVWFTRIDLKQQQQLIATKKWFSEIK
ncbi:FixH family protein [Chlorobium sp. KB01]|uniref:FixH family protein n=1 Tax=Chlorobium sp. KB01 TaxID=1917528 RepID=UPI0009754306|nr:FixH family protein [Chlorobium sp. KB01]